MNARFASIIIMNQFNANALRDALNYQSIDELIDSLIEIDEIIENDAIDRELREMIIECIEFDRSMMRIEIRKIIASRIDS